MVDGESDELLVQTQQEPSEMTALLKVLRQGAEKARRAKHVEGTWEAHQRNDCSTMHRLRIQHQRNGRGPQKRYYQTARTHWPKEDWLRELGKRPEEGGLAAQEIDLDEYVREQRERIEEQLPLPEDTEAMALMLLDKGWMLNYCKTCSKTTGMA
eukprot:3099668-Pyramimonas_sp.AAC.1